MQFTDAGIQLVKLKAQMDGYQANYQDFKINLSGLDAMSGKLTNAANVLNGITIDPNSLGNLKELSEK